MIQTVGQAPINNLLPVTDGIPATIDFSDDIGWAAWFNVLFGVLLNVGPTLRKVTDVTFPPCGANASVDVHIPFLGVAPATATGEIAPVVTLGLSSHTGGRANNLFSAWVSAQDVVTIREFCGAGGIAGFTDTFTICVLMGEPGVQ
jgi:hypothetical protein